QVFDVGITAKALDAVISAFVDLNEVELGLFATAAQSEAIDLIVLGQFVAGILDSYEFQGATVVLRIIAAVHRVRRVGKAFDVVGAVLDVDRRVAKENDSAPIARFASTHRLTAGKDDRSLPGAFSDEL